MSKKVLASAATSLAAALMVVQAQAATGPSKSTTLANASDFIIISDIDASTFQAYLSYAGTQFNHCGVAIRTPSWIDVLELQKVLTIDAGAAAVTQIENGRLVAKLADPARSSYGGFFTIKSLTGASIKDALLSLNQFERAEAFVEILGCK